MKLRINNLNAPVIDEMPKLSAIYPDGEFSSQKRLSVVVSRGGKTVFKKTFRGDARVLIPLVFDMEPMKKYDVKATSETVSGKKYTAETTFSTGSLGGDPVGRWITASDVRRTDEALAAVYLRREFSAKAKPRRAMLYISGLGYFEAHINGEKVGDDFLSTPYTSYDKHILYRAFDVTEMINAGDNAIGVILGNGFYNCFTEDAWQTRTAPWRDVPKMMCELHIEYEDGEDIVKSDASWECVHGPITFNGIRHGEEYDARLEKDGWDKPRFTGETYPSRRVKAPGAIMRVMEMEPIRVREKFTPVLRRKGKNGWIYELSQDIGGICSITFSGKAGTK
ncbi:MAG: alpha-L-rhamnosidase N-terminal domain-containing protein, partial [Clostridia bacterium]|nr:alpha-L-rhamnosidase N-terminal domain-containing protein [Clostridia bacterium]